MESNTNPSRPARKQKGQAGTEVQLPQGVQAVPDGPQPSGSGSAYHAPNWRIVLAISLQLQEDLETILAQVGDAKLNKEGQRALKNIRTCIDDDLIPVIVAEARQHLKEATQ